MGNKYYEAPPDEQFKELKSAAIKIWSMLGAEPSYSEEKINRIKNIHNVKDNFMYVVAMFDLGNQRALSSMLSDATRLSVRERIIAGGQPEEYNPF